MSFNSWLADYKKMAFMSHPKDYKFGYSEIKETTDIKSFSK